MKNFLKFYSVLFIVILVFALDGCKKQEKEDTSEEQTSITRKGDTLIISKDKILIRGMKHNVVLLVDVDKIKENSKGRDFCNFPDGYPYPNDSIENFTTDVQRGDTIVWLGVSTSAPNEDTIKITDITHDGGPHVVETQVYPNGTVVGVIKDDAERKKKEKYIIKFKVEKEGIPPKTFQIDPKIRVH